MYWIYINLYASCESYVFVFSMKMNKKKKNYKFTIHWFRLICLHFILILKFVHLILHVRCTLHGKAAIKSFANNERPERRHTHFSHHHRPMVNMKFNYLSASPVIDSYFAQWTRYTVQSLNRVEWEQNDFRRKRATQKRYFGWAVRANNLMNRKTSLFVVLRSCHLLHDHLRLLYVERNSIRSWSFISFVHEKILYLDIQLHRR